MFCLWKNRSFWCQWHDAWWYDSDEFAHFSQDCLDKIPPSGTPCHQDKSSSRHHYTPHLKGQIRLHVLWFQIWETFYQSCCHSYCDRSSSFRRHTLSSSSSHHSSLHPPLAHGCPHHLSYHDTNLHSYISSCTHLFSCRCHSTPLHRPELVSLQQLPSHYTGNTAKKGHGTSKTINPP